MKLLSDLFPIILFFVAYKTHVIYAATAIAIVASVGQIAWLKLRRRAVDNMLWASLVIIVVFGCMTLLGCHDVCPKQLPLATQIAFLRRKMVAMAWR